MKRVKLDFPILQVTWVDAEEIGDTGWNSTKDMLKEAKKAFPTMLSVGYCIHRDEDHITLLSTYNPTVCSTIEKIPMSFVLNINELVKKELPDADL